MYLTPNYQGKTVNIVLPQIPCGVITFLLQQVKVFVREMDPKMDRTCVSLSINQKCKVLNKKQENPKWKNKDLVKWASEAFKVKITNLTIS